MKALVVFQLLDHAFSISRPSSSAIHRVPRGGGARLRRPREGVVLPPVPPDVESHVLSIPIHQRAQLHSADQPSLWSQPRASHLLQICRPSYCNGELCGCLLLLLLGSLFSVMLSLSLFFCLLLMVFKQT